MAGETPPLNDKRHEKFPFSFFGLPTKPNLTFELFIEVKDSRKQENSSMGSLEMFMS